MTLLTVTRKRQIPSVFHSSVKEDMYLDTKEFIDEVKATLEKKLNQTA